MALLQTPPARARARCRDGSQHPAQRGAIMRGLALVTLVTSIVWLSINPAAAQVSASGTMLPPKAAASAPDTGHFVSGVADALPKAPNPNHTQNTQSGSPGLQMPSRPLVLHPVMPSLPVIPPPHSVSIAVSGGMPAAAQPPTQARDVAQVDATQQAQIQPQPATTNPVHAAVAPMASTPGGGLLPPPRIDPSIGAAETPAPTKTPTKTPNAAPASGAAAPAPAMQAPIVIPGAESNDAIRASAEQFVRQQTAGLPGQVGITVTPVTPRGLAACDALQAFLPPGAHLWGRSLVGVRCVGAHPWTLYLQVLITVNATYFVASHEIAANQVITATDLTPREGDLTNLPRSVVTDLSQIVGKASLERISAGLLLRQDMARTVAVIQAGQSVRLEVQGSGFSISYEGNALTSAGAGETIRVRTASGQEVSGVVKDHDTVEIPL